MTKFNKNQLNLLEELGKERHVYIIFDKYGNIEPQVFICREFREATQPNIPFHSLSGYINIDNIISQNSSYVHTDNSLNIVLTTVDGVTPTTKQKKFDGNGFYWLKF